MASQSLHFPWKTHLFYWLLLSACFGWFYQQKLAQLRVQRTLGSCLEEAVAALTRENERYLDETERYADAYRYETGEKFRNNARRISSALGDFSNTFRAPETTGWDVFRTPQPDATSFAQLKDSLWLLAPAIEEIQWEVSHYLENDTALISTEPLSAYLKRAEPFDARQMLAARQLRAALAGRSLLRYYAFALMPDGEFLFDRYMPVLSAQKQCLRTGETFDADIFLAGYAPQQFGTKVTINGASYPLEEGLVKYRHVFQKPGNYTLRTQFMVKNPLTKEVRVYQRDFEVAVQP